MNREIPHTGWKQGKMKISTLLRVVVLAMASVLLTTACGGDSDAPDARPAGDIDGMNVYLVGVGNLVPWSKRLNKTFIDRFEEKGAKVTHLQDQLDPQVQVQNLDRAVAARPDLIMLVGLDYPALTPGLTRAKKAGIPVVNVVSPPETAEDLFVLSVESDHANLGKYAGQNVVEGLKAQGKTGGNVIAITGIAGAEQVDLRMAAFKKELAGAPGVKLVAIEDGKWDQATSQQVAQQLFAKFASRGGIQAAYGMADNQALGIIQGAKQSGLKVGGSDGLIVTGSNCYMDGLKSIKANEMYGSATQSPEEEANYAMDMTFKYLAGEKLDKRLMSPSRRITAKTVDSEIEGKVCP